MSILERLRPFRSPGKSAPDPQPRVEDLQEERAGGGPTLEERAAGNPVLDDLPPGGPVHGAGASGDSVHGAGAPGGPVRGGSGPVHEGDAPREPVHGGGAPGGPVHGGGASGGVALEELSLGDPAPGEAPDRGLEEAGEGDPEGVVPPPRLLLTPAAVARIREMMEEEDLVEEGGLRIRASTGAGCSAPMRFALVLEERPDEEDVVLDGQGIRLLLDPVSAWMLDGLFVDWVDAPGMGEGFAFRHPRGAGGRAC